MRYSDPNRPTVAGRPALVNSKGEAMGIVPRPSFGLYTEVGANWIVSVWLQVDDNMGFAECTCLIYDANEFLNAYFMNPEKVLKEQFNYTFEPKQRLPKQEEIARGQGLRKPSLEDLFNEQ